MPQTRWITNSEFSHINGLFFKQQRERDEKGDTGTLGFFPLSHCIWVFLCLKKSVCFCLCPRDKTDNSAPLSLRKVSTAEQNPLRAVWRSASGNMASDRNCMASDQPEPEPHSSSFSTKPQDLERRERRSGPWIVCSQCFSAAAASLFIYGACTLSGARKTWHRGLTLAMFMDITLQLRNGSNVEQWHMENMI